MGWQKERKILDEKADVGMRTVALKRVNGQIFAEFQDAMLSLNYTLSALNAEIVVPSKTHSIHFYK